MAPITGELTKMRAEQRRQRAMRNLAIFTATLGPGEKTSGCIGKLGLDELAAIGVTDEMVLNLRAVFKKAEEKHQHTTEMMDAPDGQEKILHALNRMLKNTVVDLDAVFDVRRVVGSYAEPSDLFRAERHDEPKTFEENIHASFDIHMEVDGVWSKTYANLKFDGVVGVERYTVNDEERVRYKHVRATATEPYMKAGNSNMAGLHKLFRKLLIAIGMPRVAVDALVITWVHTDC